MELSDKVAASSNVVAREVSNETVLLNLDSGIYFGLNAVGGRIWSLIEDNPQTLASVCEALRDEFDVGDADLQRDVLDLAGQMHEHGLLDQA